VNTVGYKEKLLIESLPGEGIDVVAAEIMRTLKGSSNNVK